ncbi:MAG TPA: SDR family NAD(P)-dependent oxidoreductase [Actinomycetes bacterium]|nr:SDR family NAD(P)-dependent oxidoreductase [Actinomycetes bacterium]
MTTGRVALVTGASSGIGKATAVALQQAGFSVYATARSSDDLKQLEQLTLHAVELDVTDDRQATSRIREIEKSHGHIDVLVNNAGYSLQQPIETAEPAAVRRQFETNVFAPARLSQLVLPAMRSHGNGRIINVGSMGGRFTLPGGGYYHATKHALEAISDALRLEVASFGVKVILIQPGPVQSEFGRAAVDSMTDEGASDGPYAPFMRELQRAMEGSYDGLAGRFDATAGDVARVIVRAATTAHPRPRYAVGATARMLITGRRLLPDQLWDAAVRRIWPTP